MHVTRDSFSFARITQAALLAVVCGVGCIPTAATAASNGSGASVYGESAMVKVRPDRAPRADTGVGLAAGRNEFASFQVVLNGGPSGLKNVRAKLSSLASSDGTISGRDLDLYRVGLLNLTQSTFPGGATGAWPDALIPDRDENKQEQRNAFPFDAPANEARTLWADVHVPVGAKPGVYTGTVRVTADGGFLGQVAVTLTVLDFTLPSTSSMSSAYLLFPGNVCLAHTGAVDCGGTAMQDGLTAEYLRMALEHRISIPNVFTQPSGTDWSAYDATYGAYLDGTADTRLPGARLTSVQYTGTRTAAAYASFAAHLKQKGWYDRAYDYTGDEPPYGITYADIASRTAVVHQGAPDMPVLVTTTVQNAAANGILNGINILAPVVNYLDGTEAPYLGNQRAQYDGFLQQPGHKLWTYQSCMSHGCAYGSNAPENTSSSGWPAYAVDASAGRNRAMQWVSFLENVGGELYYETAGTLPNAWTTQWSYNGNGDGNLFYPGTPAQIGGTSDVPVASIRLKLLRQSMQDFEWLKAVKDAGDPAFAHAVAKAVTPSAFQASDDGPAYDRARLELAARYLQLTHKRAALPVQGAPPAAPDANPSLAITQGADPVTEPSSGANALQAITGGLGTGGKLMGSGPVRQSCSLSPEGASLVALGLLGGVLRRRRACAQASSGRGARG